MPKKRSGGGLSPTQQAAKFLGVSVLAGAVMAGIALPAVGALGLAAKGSVESFDELPANLKTPPLSQRTTILDADGGLIATVYSRDRTVVDLKDISPYMQKAIVAIEDSRFYEHGAIDLKGVLRALNKNARSGEVSEGASTLTQQYVKNVFVEEAGDDPTKVAQATQQTIGRKIQELKYAIQVEEELGKKKILENYLNITFFGQQAYGVEAASQRYFSKPAKDLNLQESALLAGHRPVAEPLRPGERRGGGEEAAQRRPEADGRGRRHLARAGGRGDALPARPQGQQAAERLHHGGQGRRLLLRLRPERVPQRPGVRQGQADPGEAVEPGRPHHPHHARPAGPGVRPAVAEGPRQQERRGRGRATLVEPGTGKIVGMGQSKPYGSNAKEHETEINYSVNYEMGTSAGFPTGSTFKPFVAAAALEAGRPPTQEYPSPYELTVPSPIQTCGKPYTNDDGTKIPNENESEKGPYQLKEAMALSVNTYFIEMVADIGLCPVAEMAEKLHVRQGSGKKMPQVPSIALGTESVSPLTMASAYAAFANRGMYCTPVAIESVTQRVGNKNESLEVPKSSCSRAMSENTADTINALLKGVVDSGTGQQAGLGDRDNAGKTGTTDERRNAWFVGYTPNLSGAVWVGSATQQVKMQNITIGGVYHELVYGADTPGPIWKDAMTGALEGKEAESFVPVHIPDPKPEKPENPGPDRDDDGNGDGGFIGGLINGGNGNGGNGNGGGDGGEPDPEFSIPEGFIQGPGNGPGGRD